MKYSHPSQLSIPKIAVNIKWPNRLDFFEQQVD